MDELDKLFEKPVHLSDIGIIPEMAYGIPLYGVPRQWWEYVVRESARKSERERK